MVGKLRRQIPGLVPASPYYALLGRSRKLRLLYQVVVDPDYLAPFLLPENSERAPDHHGGDMEMLDKKLFMEHNVVLLGADFHANLLLVEAYPDFKSSKCPAFRLITAISDSRPPRSGEWTDMIRGSLILVLFLTLVVAASFVKTIQANLPAYFWCLALFALAIRVITWKQALGAIPPTIMIMFAMAEALGTAMKDTGTVTVRFGRLSLVLRN